MPAMPHIVWFITDDTGFDMLGFTGGRTITPNIDRIAEKGVICRNFHTVSAACGPSRYSYLSGLYPGHCPAPRFRNSHPVDRPHRVGFDVDLLPPQPNIAGALHEAGYFTGYVGKYHCGTPRGQFHGHKYQPGDDPADPTVAAKLGQDYDAMREQVRSNGFDYAEGISWGNTDGRPIKALQYHNIEWHTEAALKFIAQARQADKPMFLVFATTTIHGPHHIESLNTDGRQTEFGYLEEMPSVQPSRQSVIERTAAAGFGPDNDHQVSGAIWTDDAFGTVMNRMQELGLDENTIYVYGTDHGPGTINSKFTCYQGGSHIPFCMSWPGHIEPGSTCDALMQNVDMPATLLDMVGLKPPADAAWDGKSRWAAIRGADEGPDDIFYEFGRARAVRTKRWKYLAWRYTPEEIEKMKSGEVDKAIAMSGGARGDFAMHHQPDYFDPDQLYDLDADPTEQHNLANDPAHAEVLQDMQRRLRHYLDQFDHPFDLNVDPFCQSPEYRKLAENSRADQSIYAWDWYKQRAY